MAEGSNDKIQQYLDGEVERQKLSSREARESAQHEAILREAKRLYQSVDAPDLTARITARLASSPSNTTHNPLRRLWTWLWQAQPMPVRPAYPLAAAVLLLLIFSQTNQPPPPGNATPPPVVDTVTIFVQFRLDAPEASNVHLVGSFTGWKPAYALRETAPGIWSVVVPLEPGVHDYAFLVNGKWITDPVAPAVDDGFGGANSRLLVVVPDTSSRL